MIDCTQPPTASRPLPVAASCCLVLAILACSLAIPRIVAAQESVGTTADSRPVLQEDPPAPLTHYMDREIAQTMHYFGAPWLIRESRQREEDCELMLEQLKLRPGMVVADLGCGNGFYTLKMAEQVGPTGKVLAVDIQPEMLRLMEARAAEAGLKNIESVLATPSDPQLPPNSLDLVLLVDVYHELSHPPQVLANLRAALKPTGLAVLVEFRAEDDSVPIKPLHKMSRAQIMKEWTPNGFRLHRQFDELPWQHMLFFAR